MTYHPRAHFDDCRSSICGGCYDDPLAPEAPEIVALAASVVESRAALVAAGKAITPKTFELDLPAPTQGGPMSAYTYRPPTRATLTDAEREMGRPMFVGETRVGVAFTERDVEHVLAAREQALREEIARDQRHRGQVVEALLEALGLTDDTTEEEARALLDGCDCNGEEGTLHLIHHLAARGGAR